MQPRSYPAAPEREGWGRQGHPASKWSASFDDRLGFQVIGDIGRDIAHSPLKADVLQQPAKGIRSRRVLSNVEGLSSRSLGLGLLAPHCQLRSSAYDDALSFRRV